jgi:hypothetical protein
VPCKNQGSTPEERRVWRDGIYDQIRDVMPLQGGLSIERMCELARVSRASFYRSLKEQRPAEEEMEVRSAVLRLMRRDNLLRQGPCAQVGRRIQRICRPNWPRFDADLPA